MPEDRPLLSVVCPAYEEAEVLPHFHAALTDALSRLADGFRIEIIYVDDGSRDGTLPVLRGLARADGRVHYLSLSRNFGHQAALTAGMEHARGDAVVTLDSDLQHPPALIPELVARWRAGFDVVLTIRADDPRLGWFKRASSALFYRLMRRWSDIDVRASASDFRLLSRPAADALVKLRETHRYLRGMVQWLGFATAEVPFQPDPRKAGASKYTLRRMVRLALDGLLSFSRVPLRLAIGTGLAVTALSCAVSLAVGLFPRANPVLVLLVDVHLLGGCILAAVGAVGAYVVRVYEEAKGRPIYVVKEASPALAAARDRAMPAVFARHDSAAA
jgi:dolichol-phosphate mannosyltransferase